MVDNPKYKYYLGIAPFMVLMILRECARVWVWIYRIDVYINKAMLALKRWRYSK